MSGEDVVGKRKPMQERVYLLAPAHRKLVKAPLSEPSVHALRQTAAFVDAFTVRALHAFALPIPWLVAYSQSASSSCGLTGACPGVCSRALTASSKSRRSSRRT